MSSSALLARWSGLAAMLAGGILVVAFLLTELVSDVFFWLFGLFMLLLAVALTGLHARQAASYGRLGLGGFVLVMIGAAIFVLMFAIGGVAQALFGFDPEESAAIGMGLLAGFLAVLVGMVLFGIATARAGVFPRAAAVLVALGLPLALAIDLLSGAFSSEEDVFPVGPLIGFPIFAIGLIWLGYTLWSEEASAAQQPSRVR